MEKRLLIAAALSVAVLVLWEVIAPKPPAPEPARPSPVTVSTPPATATPAPPANASASPVPAPSPAAAVPEVSAPAEERVVVDRPLYRAVFSNRGAVLVSYILKKYDDDQGQPLEMVHFDPSARPSDLSLDFGPDAEATRAANASLYEVTRTRDGGERIRFRFSGSGRAIDKTFVFGDGYLISTEIACAGTPPEVAVNLGPGLRNLSAKEKENRFTGSSGAVYFDGERARSVPHQKVDAVQQGALPAGGFVGLEDNYFLAALVPEGAAAWKLEPVKDPKNGVEVRASAVAARNLKAKLFIGPKDLDVLSALNLHLEETVSFRTMGINLGWIAKALIWLLKAAHRYVIPNWGVAILIVTFLVRLLLFPLMHKSFVGMKKMQKLQPKINAIKDRYKKAKSDAEQRNKMNQEMMALYQSEGYNPMSGCLPMLLQMPVFFAFYVILEKAIELRHAPFFFWIKDLSAKDPTYVLLILMIASMFFQQLMTPSTVDPAQRKMFLMMPLFWGFFLKDMPAGLVLYWLFSNLLGIAQQLLINRMYDEPAPAPARKSKNAKARG